MNNKNETTENVESRTYKEQFSNLKKYIVDKEDTNFKLCDFNSMFEKRATLQCSKNTKHIWEGMLSDFKKLNCPYCNK